MKYNLLFVCKDVFFKKWKYFLYVLGEFINKAIPFLLLPFMTFYLNPYELAIVVTFQTTLLLFNLLVGGGVTLLLTTKFIDTEKKELNKLIFDCVLTVLINAFASLLLIVIINNMEMISKAIDHIQYILICAISQSFISILLIYYQMNGLVKKYIFLQIFFSTCNALFSITLLLFFGGNPLNRILGIVVAHALVALCCIFYMVMKNMISIAYFFNIKGFDTTEYISRYYQSISMLLNQVFEYFKNQIDKIILIYLFSQEILGSYSVMLQLFSIIFVISVAVERALLPLILNELKHDSKHVVIKNLILYVLFVCLIAFSVNLAGYYLHNKVVSDNYIYDDYLANILTVTLLFRSVSSLLMKIAIYLGLNKKSYFANFLSLSAALLVLFFVDSIYLPAISAAVCYFVYLVVISLCIFRKVLR